MRDAPVDTLTLVYLARLRDAFGARERARRAARRSDHRSAAARMARRPRRECAIELAAGRAVRIAVNHDIAQPDTPVRPGDEVALLPPVTGG